MTSIGSPKIIYIVEDSSRSGFGGGQRVTAMVAKKILSMRDNKKLLVIDFGHNEYFKNRLPSNTTYTGSSNKKAFIFRFVKYWSNIILINSKRDAILFTATRLSSAGVGALRLMGVFGHVRWVVHEHMSCPSNAIIKTLYISLIRRADFLLHSSATCRDSYDTRSLRIMSGYLGAEAAIQIDSCGPDDDKVKASLENMETQIRNDIRAPIRLLYAGKISEEKGIFDLIKMFKRSYFGEPTDSIKASLTICGYGKQKSLNRMLQEIDGVVNIRYIGRITPTISIYKLYDVGIVPSWAYTESLGLSAIEFSYHIGRALICTNGEAFERLYNLEGIERLNLNSNLSRAVNEVLSQRVVDKRELEMALDFEKGDRYLREALNPALNCQ